MMSAIQGDVIAFCAAERASPSPASRNRSSNGLDDDCDGAVDNGALCPGDAQCVGGACVYPCMGSDFVCHAG